ncbi:MAG: maleylpyruvate isomerase N-terminal domain-containing protein [Nocardioidaceae bacterium]
MTRAGASLVEAARSALELLARPEVAERWGGPSALPDMSVGALAVHLGSQVRTTRSALADPALASDEVPVPLLSHYSSSAWVEAGVDDEVNVAIRRGAEEQAVDGVDALRDHVRTQLDDVVGLLDRDDLPVVVRMPWWDWSLTLDDFLVTRTMELVVHADDLAVSLGVETPPLPATVLEPVLSLLVGAAVQRHGHPAVLRALARQERAPGSIAAF